MVGRGRWGRCIERTLEQLPDFALCWVCDPTQRAPSECVLWPADTQPVATQSTAREPARWTSELTSQICRDVDVVIVATPADLHVEPTLLALAAGRPGFVEKPFTTSYNDALRVASAAAERVLMVGHLLVYHPAYRTLCTLVQDGVLGTIRDIEVERHSPSRPGAVIANGERCPWWTLAPHDLAILTRLLGAPRALRVRRNEGLVHAGLDWSGARARLRYATAAESKTRRITVTGSLAQAEIDELGPHLTLTRGGFGERVELLAEPPLTQELRHFAACARGEHSPETGLDDALQNVRLLEQGARDMARSSRVPTSPGRPNAGVSS